MVTLPFGLIHLRAGATITYAPFAINGEDVPTVVVEMRPDGTAEIDNGHI